MNTIHDENDRVRGNEQDDRCVANPREPTALSLPVDSTFQRSDPNPLRPGSSTDAYESLRALPHHASGMLNPGNRQRTHEQQQAEGGRSDADIELVGPIAKFERSDAGRNEGSEERTVDDDGRQSF